MSGSEHRKERFDALFAAHGADIVAFCTWRAGSPSDAQDAAAEVFLTTWRRVDDVPDGDAARVWLYATARKVIANQRRSNRRRVALQERLHLERASEAHSHDSQDLVVYEALRRLSRRDREVLLLSEWEDLSPAEIAAVLGCLTVTARGRLHRARHRFRAAYLELRNHSNESRSSLRPVEGGS